jgi:hypothetical protein
MFDKISAVWLSSTISPFKNSQTAEMRRDMNLTKIIFLLLVVQSLCCAGPLPRQDASQVEKERQEEKKESAPPTFIYRP